MLYRDACGKFQGFYRPPERQGLFEVGGRMCAGDFSGGWVVYMTFGGLVDGAPTKKKIECKGILKKPGVRITISTATQNHRGVCGCARHQNRTPLVLLLCSAFFRFLRCK